MTLLRLLGRARALPVIFLLSAIASSAAAQVSGLSQLGGWVYIDRNNDGVLNFASDPNPEFAIGDVTVGLYSKVGSVETFVTSLLSDQNGRYLFQNINPGTYVLRETQPVEYVDGLDTLGKLQSLDGQPIPPSASAGVMTDNTFSDIVLTANVGGDYYNFGERGLAAGYASKRYLLASAPPLNPVVPEPASITLSALAIGGCCFARRRRRIAS